MKKLTLSIGLLAIMLYTSAQDTTCTYFTGELVIEFNYITNEPLYEVRQINKFYEIELKHGDVLCLDLSDHKNRVRKILTTFFDGSVRKDILNSKDNVYYTPKGTEKVSVSKRRIKL